MVFKFQINKDVEFNHDDDLLTKADQYRPKLLTNKISAKRLVELTDDPSKLENTGIKEVGDIEQLAQLKMTRNDHVIIDFGQHCVGKFAIHIEHVGSPMDAPVAFKVKFAEMPNEFRYNSQDYDGWLSKSWIQEEVIHLDRLPAELELPRRYSFRYVELSVIDTSPKWFAVFSKPTATIQSAVSSTNLRKPDFKDDKLNAIYQVGINTLQDCMQDVFEDGPKRDRRLWLGDLRLQALANYASFDNTALVKRCLYLFGAMTAKDGRISANVFTNQPYVPDDTFMYDYSLFFISTLADLEKHEKDEEVLTDLYPIAKKQWEYTRRFIRDNGEVVPDQQYVTFVDWSNDFDKTTAGQAITIYVLRQLIALAKMINDPELAKYEQELENLKNFATDNQFDPQTGLFVSGKKSEVNIASQVWMVLAHVMDDETNHQIMTKTVNKLFPVRGIATPYMYHHIDQALFEAGMKDEAIKLMKEYWGKMVDLGADTFWEAFEPENPAYSPYDSPIENSFCHAWSCTPIWLLSKYMSD